MAKKPVKKVAIFVPLALPFGMVPQEFFLSFDDTKEHLMQHIDELPFEPRIEIFAPGTFPVDANRNHCVGIAISRDFDITVWFDADQKLEQDTLLRLLKPEFPIVAGAYYLKAEPFHPIVFKAEDDFKTFRPLWRYPTNEYYYADMIGVGCVRIDVSVLKKLKQPYFKYGKIPLSVTKGNEDMTFKREWGVDDVSEDVHFWKQVKEAGFKIIVDPQIQVGHIRKHVVTGEYAMHQARINKALTQRELGDKFAEYWEKNTAKAVPISVNGKELIWAL